MPVDLSRYDVTTETTEGQGIDLSRYQVYSDYEPGETPESPILEEHPKLRRAGFASFKDDRHIIQNVLRMAGPEAVARHLQGLGLEGRESEHGWSIREPGGPWYVLDEPGFTRRDIGDLVGEGVSLLGGGAGLAATAGKGLLTRAAGTGLGMAGAELALQETAGEGLDLPTTQGERLGAAATSGAVGAAGELALGGAGKGIRAVAGKLRGRRPPPRPEVGPMTTEERLVASQAKSSRAPATRDLAAEAQERMLRQKLEVPLEEKAAREAKLREELRSPRQPPPEAPGPTAPAEPPPTPPVAPAATETPRYPRSPFHGAEERYPAKAAAIPGVRSSPQEEAIRGRLRRMDEGAEAIVQFVKRTPPAKGEALHERRALRFKLRPRYQVRSELSREGLEGLSEKELREAALDWHVEAAGKSRAQLIDDLLASGKEPGLGPGQAPIKGKKRAYEPEEKNLRWVWDTEKRAWRSIPLDQVETLVTTEGGKRLAWVAVRRTRGVGRAGYPKGIESPAGRGAPFGKEPKPYEATRLDPEIEKAVGKGPPEAGAGALKKTRPLDPEYRPADRAPMTRAERTGPLYRPDSDIPRGSAARQKPSVKLPKPEAKPKSARSAIGGAIRYGLRSAAGRTGRRIGASVLGHTLGGPGGGLLGYLGMRGAEKVAEGGAGAVKAKIRGLLQVVPEAIRGKLRLLERLDPGSARFKALAYVLARDPAFRRWAEAHPEALSGSEG